MYEPLESPVFLCRFIDVVQRLIRSARRSIKIYTGEANDAIFDDPELIRAIEDCYFSGVKIQIVAGPVLLKGGDRNSPMVINLAYAGLVRLYIRPTRGKLNHFCIFDDERIWYEQPHEPLELLHSRPERTMIRLGNALEYLPQFQRYVREENSCLSAEEKFLILSHEELRRLMDAAKRQGVDLNVLTKNELKRLSEVTEQLHHESEQEGLTKLAGYLNSTWQRS